MLFSTSALTVLATLQIVFSSVNASPTAMKQLEDQYKVNTHKQLKNNPVCTPRNIALRKEWGDLTNVERLEYISAVKCLHRLPSKINPSKAPGARSRFDDFQASHIINTKLIHGTGLFFSWHRHFVYLYETALREECGYPGYQPYWDWPRYADLPVEQNPLYDGSFTSMSGNGAFIPNRNGTIQPFPIPIENPPVIYTPPGTGGGYIQKGPFADWELHLGPVIDMNVKNGKHVNNNPLSSGLGFNPRRMIRDFNPDLLQNASYSVVTSMLADMTSIHTFHPYLFEMPHLAGHSFISAYDNDLFTSPGDPLFWFHHAQVDRMWSIWQSLDFSTREYALDGTMTLINVPPSRNATLDDVMNFEGVGSEIPIRTAMSPTKESMCYMYV